MSLRLEGGFEELATRDALREFDWASQRRNMRGLRSLVDVSCVCGNTLAHEIGHVLGLGHRGVLADPVPDGLTVPGEKNLMHPTAPPPVCENLDLIQTKAARFSELMFRNP